jgi:hypothetical protein
VADSHQPGVANGHAAAVVVASVATPAAVVPVVMAVAVPLLQLWHIASISLRQKATQQRRWPRLCDDDGGSACGDGGGGASIAAVADSQQLVAATVVVIAVGGVHLA